MYELGHELSYLQLNKGDLITLDDHCKGNTIMNGGWGSGYCERTRKHGDFPFESVSVIPTMSKPTDDLLVTQLSHYCTIIALTFDTL